MLFNDFVYIFVFVPIVFFSFFSLIKLKNVKVAKFFLFFSSVFFYCWESVTYLPLLLFSIVFNYCISKGINITNTIKYRKLLLTIGIICNLLILGFFKYINITIDSLDYIFSITVFHISFPLAISYYTFQQVAFLIDSFRQEINKYTFLDYAIFVSFFPQLISGPIILQQEIMPQLAILQKKLNFKNIAIGLFIFTIGLFKKVVIADTFAVWADSGFDVANNLDFFEAWATSLSYTFQIYFDFSGYTDMAIGSALLFNIKIPTNFNSPYKSTNIREFWRRWHITLSRFLKNYIYIPLGGSKKGDRKTYNNLMITFIVAGLWHGAGWNFLLWGVLHGIALIIHRYWDKSGFRLWKRLSWLLTFAFINCSWIFFRSKNFEDAINILSSMFSLKNIVIYQFLKNTLSFLSTYGIKFDIMFQNMNGSKWTFILIFIGFIFVLCFKNSNEIIKELKSNYTYLVFGITIFLISILYLNSIRETVFIYNDF